MFTMKKTVKMTTLKDQAKRDLAYWLSRPPEERIAAVTFLMRQFYDIDDDRTERLPGSVTVTWRDLHE
jgi:hypothetical protein